MFNLVYEKLIFALNSRSTQLLSVKCDEFFALVSFLFTPEEAAIAAAMPSGFATVEDIATYLPGKDTDKLAAELAIMVNKGLVRSKEENGGIVYELLPLIPGIVEMQLYKDDADEFRWRLNSLLIEYNKALWKMSNAGTLPQPAVSVQSRKIPIGREALNKATAIPYAEVKELIENSEYVSAGICHCRSAGVHLGKPCSRPMDNCMVLGPSAKYTAERGLTRLITKEQALQMLNAAEEAALVHTYSDTPDHFINILCNCCNCHCASLRGWIKSPSPRQCIEARYLVRIDEDACIACEACIERCQTRALKIVEGKVTRDENRCIGCGLCMYACLSDALILEPTAAGKIPLKKC